MIWSAIFRRSDERRGARFLICFAVSGLFFYLYDGMGMRGNVSRDNLQLASS